MRNRSYLIFLLASQALAAFILVIVRGVSMPTILVPAFTMPWLGLAVLMSWLELAPVVTYWVIFLRFGLLPVLKRESVAVGEKFAGLKQAVFFGGIWFVILSGLYLVLHPLASAGEIRYQRSSEYARYLLDQALEQETLGEFYQALELAEASVTAAPGFRDAETARERLFHRLTSLPAPLIPETIQVKPGPVLNQSFGELIARAQAYFDEEDFFSALYYADRAAELSGMGRDPRALSLRQEARRKIQAAELSEQDFQARERFSTKRLGVTALEEGQYIDAYYIFKALEDQEPTDPDILEWFPKVKDALRQVSFFKEEAEASLGQWSRARAVAWRELKEGQVWVYSAATAVRARRMPNLDEVQMGASTIINYYFSDLEVAVLDSESGAILAVGRAPLAKAAQLARAEGNTWYLLTTAIPSPSPGINSQLEWTGLDDGILAAQEEVYWDWGLIPLPHEPEIILETAGLGEGMAAVNTARLLSSIGEFRDLGYSALPLQAELLWRLGKPLLDLLLLAYLLAAAWSSRITHAGPNLVLAFGMLPVLFVALYAFYALATWILKLSAAWLAGALGFAASLAIIAVSLALLLILGMILLFVRHAE